MSKPNRPTKAKLLELLKKNEFIKQKVADLLGVDEKSVRRWCREYEIDTDFERKRTILEYEPLIVVPKTSIIKPHKPTGKLERVFVFSDAQIPYHSPQAFSVAIQSCRDYKPTHVVIIGDYLDYNPLLGKASQRDPVLLTEELKALDLEFLTGAKILADIESVLPKGCVKIFIKGNHEDRADKIIEKPNGEYWKKHIDIDIRLGLSARGWQVVKYNDFVKLGHLNYTHGAFYDTHHAQHHARVYSENVMYGHTHQVQIFTMPTPVRELAFWSASIGCLADVNPEWQRGKPNAHDHAFAEVDYADNGDFFPNIHRIIHGRLIHPRGKVYKA